MYRVLQNNHLLRDYPDFRSAQDCVRAIVAGYLRNNTDILSVFCGKWIASITFEIRETVELEIKEI